MYKVNDKQFKTFEEVDAYAWNSYKIDVYEDIENVSEEIKQQACEQLEQLINELNS